MYYYMSGFMVGDFFQICILTIDYFRSIKQYSKTCFDKTLTINPPKYKDALKIVEFYLSKKKAVADVNIEEITRILSGRSCAELETVINEAGVYAGFAGKKYIEMDSEELKYAEWVKREDIILQPGSFSLTNEMMKMFKEGKI